MEESLEKISIYALGCMGGVVAETIFVSKLLPFITDSEKTLIIAISALSGLLVASIAIEMREEAERRKNNVIRDETVALMTHEMKTGLTSTGWAIEMILENYADKITQEDKKTLEGVVNSIHTTVMHSVNLLDISMLDIGKLKISLEKVSLDVVEKVFKDTVEKYRFGAEKVRIKLVSDITLDPEKQVEVDMLRLRIILENLLENALQYTTGDVKEIRVIIKNDTNTMRITVSDTGIGIPDEEKEKIFQKFFRASNARKKLSSGSGIGMYVCKQYVKAHRGAIEFKSKQNEGTTFNIAIPLKTVANVNEFLTKI